MHRNTAPPTATPSSCVLHHQPVHANGLSLLPRTSPASHSHRSSIVRSNCVDFERERTAHLAGYTMHIIYYAMHCGYLHLTLRAGSRTENTEHGSAGGSRGHIRERLLQLATLPSVTDEYVYTLFTAASKHGLNPHCLADSQPTWEHPLCHVYTRLSVSYVV